MVGSTRRPRSLLTLLAALLLAGCGSSAGGSTNVPTSATQGAGAATEPASSAAPANGTASAGSNGGSTSLDGCQIVTAADAQAVFSVPVTKSEVGTKPQQLLASCVWDGGAGTGSLALVNKLLQLEIYDGAIFYAPEQYKEMPGFEVINGLGGGAYAYGTGAFDLVINVGNRTVSLGASGFAPGDRGRVRQAVLDLARKVLDRI